MSRTWTFVAVVLVATGVVWADDLPGTGPVVEPAAAETREDPPEAGSATPAGTAEDQDRKDQDVGDQGPMQVSGMSILGNQEAPKSLVIVPWKSSEIGDALGIATMLDDSVQPVDRDVFVRELRYYEIRSEKTP